MGRPLRIEFPGAVYHVTSRGDRREPIFVDDLEWQLGSGLAFCPKVIQLGLTLDSKLSPKAYQR